MPKIADIWKLASLHNDPATSPLDVKWRATLHRSLKELERVLRLLHLRVEQATELPSEVRRYIDVNFDVVSDTDLATVLSLTVDVGAYLFRASFTYDCGAGFTQYTVNGTCTTSLTLWHSCNWQDSAASYVEGTRHTSLGDSVIEATSIAGVIDMWGLVVVTVPGTLDAQFAQRSPDVAASTVLAGSWFEVQRAANPTVT